MEIRVYIDYNLFIRVYIDYNLFIKGYIVVKGGSIVLYRYFIGTGETDIISVDQVYELYQKGMINRSSKLYDVDKNVYIEAFEVPEFKDVFLEKYSNESKSTKLLKYLSSSIFFLLFLLISMINTFLKLGIEKIESNTTYFLGYMITTFIGISLLIAVVIFIFTKVFKRYGSILIISSSIIMCIISTIFLVGNIGTINAEKAEEIRIEKTAMEKVVKLYEIGLTDNFTKEDIKADEYGKYVPLVSQTQDYVLSLRRMNVGVDYLFKNMPLDQILSDKILSDIERIKKNRESIKVVLSGLSESEAENASIHDGYVAEIKNTTIPQRVKEDFVVATEKNCKIEKQEKEELYDFNMKLFQKIDEMFKFFEDRVGKYNAVGSRVIFNEKADEDRYRKLLKEYDNILEQYNKSISNSFKNDQDNIKVLNDLVKKNYDEMVELE